MLIELEGVGGGGSGGAVDVCSLGGLGSGVVHLTLFTLGSSYGFVGHLCSGHQIHDMVQVLVPKGCNLSCHQMIFLLYSSSVI